MRQRWVARLSGMVNNSRISSYRIQPFIKKHHIDMNDFIVPPKGYRSFNEFFIRSLRPKARPIDPAPHHCIAPADSKLLVMQSLTTTTSFYIKQTHFNLEEFLGSHPHANSFIGGTMMIFRLAPYDYHRIHFPADCVPSEPTVIRGMFESVNPTAFEAGIQPLITNERHLIMLQTDHFDTIAMVLVGAMMVGKIVETYQAHTPYKKGAECGYFAFGGSTVVLIFKPDIVTPQTQFVQHSLQGYETAVKMGVAINE